MRARQAFGVLDVCVEELRGHLHKRGTRAGLSNEISSNFNRTRIYLIRTEIGRPNFGMLFSGFEWRRSVALDCPESVCQTGLADNTPNSDKDHGILEIPMPNGGAIHISAAGIYQFTRGTGDAVGLTCVYFGNEHQLTNVGNRDVTDSVATGGFTIVHGTQLNP